MITEAIIVSINSDNQSCSVRVPFFETATSDTPCIIPDTPILTIPGLDCAYFVGDAVWVAFENNKIAPVVIGKLNQGFEKNRGTFNLQNLKVSDKAQLPLDTQFNTNNALNSYTDLNSIIKIITAIKVLQSKVGVTSTGNEVTPSNKYKTVIQTFINNNLITLHLITNNYYEPYSEISKRSFLTALSNFTSDSSDSTKMLSMLPIVSIGAYEIVGIWASLKNGNFILHFMDSIGNDFILDNLQYFVIVKSIPVNQI